MARPGRTQMVVGGILVAIGILLAALPKDWLEERFAIEPDAGNGLVELLLVLVPVVVGVALIARGWRRTATGRPPDPAHLTSLGRVDGPRRPGHWVRRRSRSGPTSLRSGRWRRLRRPRCSVGERTVRISNPDRVYFPATGATKLDLVDYYLAVGPGIVNALRERPCMLHRFPTGLSGEKVHQKRVPAGAPPWLETVRVHFPRYGLHADELCVVELADVIWAVQMSTVEFHPWNSRRADVERPDEWRIDLDPMPACPLATVRRVAHVVHEVLDELGAVGLAEDLRRQGDARLRPHRAGVRVPGRPPRRAGLRPRGRAARARRRDDDVVAQGPGSVRPVRRLQPERPRPHDGGGLLGAGAARGHRVDADHVGRGRRRRARGLHHARPCRSASLGSATSTAASTTPSSPSTRSSSGPSATSVPAPSTRANRQRRTEPRPGRPIAPGRRAALLGSGRGIADVRRPFRRPERAASWGRSSARRRGGQLCDTRRRECGP